MGLDISAYVNATRAPDANPDDWDSVARASVIPEFAAAADGIEHGELFTFDKQICFRAGSYSGYGQFRDELAALAGYPAYEMADGDERRHPHAASAWFGQVPEDAPFFPLINFSDCEGTIGPQTSARLAEHFAAHQAKADEHPDSYFREKYAVWRSAFEAVAGNGFVDFH